MATQSYTDYLASPAWKAIRSRVMKKAGRTCLCGARATQVHHVSYDQLVMDGKDDRDLVALCRYCHEDIHFADGEKVTMAKAGKRLKKLKARARAQRRSSKKDRNWVTRKEYESLSALVMKLNRRVFELEKGR